MLATTTKAPRQNSSASRKKDGRLRPLRILAIALVFPSFSLYRFGHHVFIIWSFNDRRKFSGNYTSILHEDVQREWDRMLFGIFTYDSVNECDLRAANRETHLNYFKHISTFSGERPDVICSLNELLNNSTLAGDPMSCRIVYTFVMGGGLSDPRMRMKAGSLKEGGHGKFEGAKTRCLWDDPECGGRDIARWVLEFPRGEVSDLLRRELATEEDITFLNIPENHELGKTDTWFTYAAMLCKQQPNLHLGHFGKMDSDNFVMWPIFFDYLQKKRSELDAHPFIYGGHFVHRSECSRDSYGRACAGRAFVAEGFVTGALAYLSAALACHAFLGGTSLAQERGTWILGEDMQLGNMAYSDPNATVYVLNHREGGRYINVHFFNNPESYRRTYYRVYSEHMKRAVRMKVSSDRMKRRTGGG